MVSKKDEPKKGPETEDLLDGFDDSFEQGIEEFGERTELNQTAALPKKGEKTEVIFEDENDDNENLQTQTSIKPSGEATEVAFKKTETGTEDLSALFEGSGPAPEVPTDTQAPTAGQRGSTEDLSSLFEGGSGSSEGFTEDLSASTEAVPPPSGASDDAAGVFTGDFSSLIQDEISSEGRTENLTAKVAPQDDIVEVDTDDDFAPAPSPVFPKPQAMSGTKKGMVQEPSGSVEPVESGEDDVKTGRISVSKNKKILMLGGTVALAAVGGLGYYFFLRSSPAPAPAVVDTSAPASGATGEQVVDSQELLRQLDQKYAEAQQFFIPDRFQGYSEAVTRLEEIVNVYPNHNKANSSLAEAMILKFDGFLDAQRKARVLQLVEKAEAVDPNTPETLRSKARALMMEGKLKDAEVRIQQALVVGPKDARSHLTAGEIQFELGNTKTALSSFSKAKALAEDWVRPKYFLHLAQAKSGDIKSAGKGFSELSAKDKPHPKSVTQKFVIQAKAGQLEKAKTELEQYLTAQEADLGPAEAAFGWNSLADFELKKGNKAGAIAALEKSVFKLPLNPIITFRLGDLYFQQNNFEKASQHYSTSVTLSPDNIGYLMQLGISLREQGRYKESEESLKKLLAKDPKNLEGLYQYSYSKYKLGYVDDITRQLEVDTSANPKYLKGKVLLGEIQLKKNEYAKAFENFQAAYKGASDASTKMLATVALGEYYLAQEQWTKARDYFRIAAEKKSDVYRIQYALSKIELELGNLSTAQGHLKRMLDIMPTSIDAKAIEGGIQMRKQDWDKAIENFKLVLEQRDADYQTRVELAKALQEKGNFAESLQELLIAYRHNTDYFYTSFYTGVAQRELNDLTESERNLQSAITMMPKNARAHYELGLTYLAMEQVSKAGEQMEEALKLDRGLTDAVLKMGDFYFDRNVFGQANEYYNRALLARPKDIDLIQRLAKTYREMGNDKKAISLYQKSAQMKPTSATYLELGILFEENNETNEAFKSYQKSASLDPKNPKPHYQLGFLYGQIGQNAKAALSFKRFLELNPDSLEKKDIEEQIRKLSGN